MSCRQPTPGAQRPSLVTCHLYQTLGARCYTEVPPAARVREYVCENHQYTHEDRQVRCRAVCYMVWHGVVRCGTMWNTNNKQTPMSPLPSTPPLTSRNTRSLGLVRELALGLSNILSHAKPVLESVNRAMASGHHAPIIKIENKPHNMGLSELCAPYVSCRTTRVVPPITRNVPPKLSPEPSTPSLSHV